jgi:hypothetical protein
MVVPIVKRNPLKPHELLESGCSRDAPDLRMFFFACFLKPLPKMGLRQTVALSSIARATEYILKAFSKSNKYKQHP